MAEVSSTSPAVGQGSEHGLKGSSVAWLKAVALHWSLVRVGEPSCLTCPRRSPILAPRCHAGLVMSAVPQVTTLY
jgi:hypothetical protein